MATTQSNFRFENSLNDTLSEEAAKVGLSRTAYLEQLIESASSKGVEIDTPKPTGSKRHGGFIQRANTYGKAVLEGKEITSVYVKKAVERSYRLSEACRSKATRWIYSQSHVKHFVEFAEGLPIHKGHGAGHSKIKLSGWQVWLVSEIYGWRLRANPNIRKHQEVLIEVARKNGKTTLCAIIALYELLHGGEVGGEIYSAATKRDQARYVLDAAKDIAKLAGLGGTRKSNKDLVLLQHHIETRPTESAPISVFKSVSRESRTLDGLSPSVLIIDEAAAISERNSIEVLTSAVVGRQSPLTIYITTAQGLRDTAYYEKREYVLQVLAGVIDDPDITGYLFVLDEGDDYLDESVWRKANPNLSVSLDISALQGAVRQAGVAVKQQAGVKLKHFNIWTDGIDQWIPNEAWDKCKSKLTSDMKESADLYLGIDLSETTDMTAIVKVYRLAAQYHIELDCWCTQSFIDSLSTSLKPIVQAFVERGELQVVPGGLIDLGEVEDRIANIEKEKRIHTIGYDPHNANRFVENLRSSGQKLYAVKQSITALNSVTKWTRDLIYARRIHHNGNELLKWHITNAKLYVDINNNHKVRKENTSAQNKIDGVSALLCAMSILETGNEESKMADMFKSMIVLDK